MDETAPKPKLTKKQRELVSLAFEVGLILLLIGVGTVTYNKRHTTTKVEEKTVTVTASPQVVQVPAAMAPGGTNETVTVPITPVAAGYTLTLNAPKSWRSVDLRNQLPLSSYPSYNANDLAALLRFVPDAPERNSLYGLTEPVNMLDVLATGRWATENEGDPATAANKQAYLAYLGSLKTASDITAKKCTPITFGGSVCTDNKVKPQLIKTADGSLSGLIYMTMQTQSVSYDPVVVVDMVGTVGGKAVRAWGKFNIYDKTYETLGGQGVKADASAKDWVNRVTEARKSFAENTSVDTLGAYDRIVGVVKSMKFAK
jgi:hypothetical protein